MTIELNNITSGYSTGLINDNFQAIEDYVNDKLLQRDGVETGEINQMEVDLDMNSRFIYNLPEPFLNHQAARLEDVQNALSGASSANLITFTPYLTITAGNLQGAVQQVKDELDAVDTDTSNKVTVGEVGAEEVTTGTSSVTVEDRFSEYVTPADYGASGDGVSDDSSAIENALLSGKPVYFGGQERVYRTTREITASLTSPLVIRSDGATITVDPSASIQRAFYIEMNGNFVYWDGPLHTDCNMLSFTGWYFSNVLEADRTGLYIKGYRVSNCYRASQDFPGGDGIWIIGAFKKVTITDIIVKDVIAADGAIVPLTQGVAGITVTRSSAEETDAWVVNISDFHIENIYSEDETETLDQDGIRVFSVYNNASAIPTQAVCNIKDGVVKNSNGRAVKLQTEWASIDGLSIVRTGSPYSSYVGNDDIDLQVSGGLLSNLNMLYTSAFPRTVIKASLRQDDSRLNVPGVSIKGVNLAQMGSGVGFGNFLDLNVAAGIGPNANVSVSGVTMESTKTPEDFITVFGNSVTWTIGVSDVLCRASRAVVRRGGNVPFLYLTGTGVHSPATATFYSEASSGNSTVTLLGSNRNVS